MIVLYNNFFISVILYLFNVILITRVLLELVDSTLGSIDVSLRDSNILVGFLPVACDVETRNVVNMQNIGNAPTNNIIVTMAFANELEVILLLDVFQRQRNAVVCIAKGTVANLIQAFLTANAVNVASCQRKLSISQECFCIAEHAEVVTPVQVYDEIGVVDGENAISFLDLLEVRFINAFRKAGVSWKFIREAAFKAQEVFNTTHPFTTQRFRTDGKHIFSSFSENNSKLTLDLNNANYAMEKVIEPFFKDIEFESDQAVRWYPYKNKKIVIDPERAFGRPILKESGIATDILYAAFNTEKDEKLVAEWYDIDIASVKSAVDYEKGLRA